MKYSHFLFLTIAIFMFSCTSTVDDGYYDSEVNTIQEAKKLEESKSSVLFSEDNRRPPKGFFPSDSLYSTSKFLYYIRHKEAPFPHMVKYYADNKDSVRFILHEWNEIIPGMTEEEIKVQFQGIHKRFKLYQEKYYAIAQDLKNKFGKNIAGDGKIKNTGLQSDPMFKAYLLFQNSETKMYYELDLLWLTRNNLYKILLKKYTL